MGTTLSQLQEVPVAGGRKGRPNYNEEFKRRLAAAACEPGVSVSKLAREHGINANMLFTWRRRYRTEQCQEAAVLLPVTVERPSSPPGPMPMSPGAAVCEPTPPHGAIEIRLGRAVIRIEGAVDASTLRTVLDRLTP
ncbi:MULTISPECIES: IS66-like element accessory protein TnpA [Cupriavidus]|uniref:Transposition-related protein (Modular protein) n=2 Tax=Cupriavidus TaxID=106589 RepID=A0A375DB14_9BURK|nr:MULTISPECIES: transposase [Cupriavidus]MCO4865962.1 transposase [Cupriavidus sp. WGlv3]MCO4893625.1 transposase [Cupriavidus sp. WGtm5]SOY75563.1 Putative transposition-related protein (modular protein) [Cupriavidus taiwanensis]SOY75821.1 Putative transposition-related protein (modular protein) [Cupriavidus taiwanensis]SOY76654.1 Putative transposition-related protein (modular protein) [Cupriavidus taiwanensis]